MKKLYFLILALTLSFAALAQSKKQIKGGVPDPDTIAAPYCQPHFVIGNTLGHYINRVNITDFYDDVKGPNADGYLNVSMYTIASIFRSETYQIVITVGTGNNETVAAWIDFDGDSIFDAGEKLGETPGMTSGESTTFTFTVPANAPIGKARVRIMTAWNVTNLDPCANNLYDYGEVTDYGYFINESAAPYCPPQSVTGSLWGDYIRKIIFNGLGYVATGADTTGKTYTNLVNQAVGMAPGTSQYIHCTGPRVSDIIIGIWVDWNNNGTFDIAERIDSLPLFANTTDSILIAVNANQPLGQYRMRVRTAYNNGIEPIVPCATQIYNSTYDMQINVGNVSVNESFADHFNLYPNPVSGTLYLNIKNGLSNNAILSVYDATGRLIQSQKAYSSPGSSIEILVTGLAKGMYILQVNENGKIAASPFIVE